MEDFKSTANPLKGDPVWNVLLIMLYSGVLFILLSCFHLIFDGEHKWNDYWTAIGTCLLLAGGCFSGGAFIGFMFGIPRVLSNPTSAPDDIKNNSKTIMQNDNLVQISDWLTKIIVGVSLTQLTNIPHFLHHLGEKFAVSTGAYENKGVNTAIILLVYFPIIGFFFGYLWSRLFFPKMLADMDKMLNPQELELRAFSNTFLPQKEAMKVEMQASIADPGKNADPQKGQWGGKTSSNNRQVTGTVVQSSTDTDLFTISLQVFSTNDNLPLSGNVIFHLHPSIPQPERTVMADKGVAAISFLAFGPFTVGIECDDKATKLEIDLGKDIKDLPPNFK